MQDLFPELVELWAEENVAVVGGAVRDRLLQRNTKDIDLAVAEQAEQFARRWAPRLGGTVVPLDPERGVVRIALADGVGWDIAEWQGESLEADLKGRDFTVNAMAWTPKLGLVDPTGGRHDLEARRLRVCSEGVFRSDPLRLLRAVRQLGSLKFDPDPALLQLLERDARLLTRVSWERIRDEFFLILRAGVTPMVPLLRQTSLLFEVLPELRACLNCTQNHYHHLDVFDHTMLVVRGIEEMAADNFAAFGYCGAELAEYLDRPLAGYRRRLEVLKLAAFLHDIGKPGTRTVGLRGRIHFRGHESLGAGMVVSTAHRLLLSKRERDYLVGLVRHHLRPVLLPAQDPGSVARHRFFRKVEDLAPDLMVHSRADVLATQGPAQTEYQLQRHLAFAKEMLAEFFAEGEMAEPALPVNGRDLIEELGVKPGPVIGSLLTRLGEARVEGHCETREEALEFARKLLHQLPG